MKSKDYIRFKWMMKTGKSPEYKLGSWGIPETYYPFKICQEYFSTPRKAIDFAMKTKKPLNPIKD